MSFIKLIGRNYSGVQLLLPCPLCVYNSSAWLSFRSKPTMQFNRNNNKIIQCQGLYGFSQTSLHNPLSLHLSTRPAIWKASCLSLLCMNLHRRKGVMTSDDYKCPHCGDTSKRSRKYIGARQAAPETAKLLVSYSILQSYKDNRNNYWIYSKCYGTLYSQV